MNKNIKDCILFFLIIFILFTCFLISNKKEKFSVSSGGSSGLPTDECLYYTETSYTFSGNYPELNGSNNKIEYDVTNLEDKLRVQSYDDTTYSFQYSSPVDKDIFYIKYDDLTNDFKFLAGIYISNYDYGLEMYVYKKITEQGIKEYDGGAPNSIGFYPDYFFFYSNNKITHFYLNPESHTDPHIMYYIDDYNTSSLIEEGYIPIYFVTKTEIINILNSCDLQTTTTKAPLIQTTTTKVPLTCSFTRNEFDTEKTCKENCYKQEDCNYYECQEICNFKNVIKTTDNQDIYIDPEGKPSPPEIEIIKKISNREVLVKIIDNYEPNKSDYYYIMLFKTLNKNEGITYYKKLYNNVTTLMNIIDLDPYENYTVFVKGYNKNGFSNLSNQVSFSLFNDQFNNNVKIKTYDDIKKDLNLKIRHETEFHSCNN